jgi:hypothetical protein
MAFHVTDSEGRNVPDASFRATFAVTDKNITVREGKTDTNGIFVAEGKTAYQVDYVVTKDGYYETRATYKFKSFEDDKWHPWNPTIEVTLKEKRNPVPMYARYAEILFPKTSSKLIPVFMSGLTF